LTNLQLYLALGIPVILQLLGFGLILLYLNARFAMMEARFEARFKALETRMDIGFAAINTRFDDMRDLWRAELTRVEGVLDARLKHLEQK
jgi:hypothetical protein